jgi:hypothetical protein
MSSVSFTEFNQWLTNAGLDLKESLVTAAEKMRDPALSAAQKWGAVADASGKVELVIYLRR